MTRNGKVLVPATVPFWPKPGSTFWLVFFDDVSRAFPWVRPPIHPSPVSVVVLTDTSAPHGCDASLVTVGSLSEGSVRVVTFPHILVGYR